MSNLKKISIIQAILLAIAIILSLSIAFKNAGKSQETIFSWDKILSFKSPLLATHATIVILTMIIGVAMLVVSIIHDEKRGNISILGILAGVFSILFILQIVSLILSIIIILKKPKGVNTTPIDQRQDFANKD